MGAVDVEMIEQRDAVGGHVRQGVRHIWNRPAVELRREHGIWPHALAVELARQPDVAVVETDHEQPLGHEGVDQSLSPRRVLRRVATHDEQCWISAVAIGGVLDLDTRRQLRARHEGECCRSATVRPMPRVVHAPGRVNLIGDHTDYVGGLVMPMAIDTGITITVEPGGDVVELHSSLDSQPCSFTLPFTGTPTTIEPAWARFVAAMARDIGATTGMTGTVDSTLPAGAGLSSSASLLCAVGLALGFDGTAHQLARTARTAEHAATGVPTGIMDQLCITSAVAGHAVLIDCRAESVEPVPVPAEAVVAVRFVEPRTLVGSGYADRVAECARVEAAIGPLREATVDDLAAFDDQLLVRRARHVITENERVRQVARAFRVGDLDAAGAVMNDGQTSLRDDYEISTPTIDAAVDAARAIPGVLGARLTGGGFGGSIVALAAPDTQFGADWTIVRPSGPARVL